MTQDEVIRLGIDICQALELCQKYNIIHRDIKPENIFVSEHGKYKLGDFGIARTIEGTATGLSKKGTYTYMAPEVYREEAYGASVDTYSLGLVLYRLLNGGRTPFLPDFPEPITFKDRETAHAKRIKGEPLPPPKNADERLCRVILKACAFHPKERYADPAQFRLDLEAVLNPEKNDIFSVPTEAEPFRRDFFPADSTQSGIWNAAPSSGERTESIFDSDERRFEGTERTSGIFGEHETDSDLSDIFSSMDPNMVPVLTYDLEQESVFVHLDIDKSKRILETYCKKAGVRYGELAFSQPWFNRYLTSITMSGKAKITGRDIVSLSVEKALNDAFFYSVLYGVRRLLVKFIHSNCPGYSEYFLIHMLDSFSNSLQGYEFDQDLLPDFISRPLSIPGIQEPVYEQDCFCLDVLGKQVSTNTENRTFPQNNPFVGKGKHKQKNPFYGYTPSVYAELLLKKQEKFFPMPARQMDLWITDSLIKVRETEEKKLESRVWFFGRNVQSFFVPYANDRYFLLELPIGGSKMMPMLSGKSVYKFAVSPGTTRFTAQNTTPVSVKLHVIQSALHAFWSRSDKSVCLFNAEGNCAIIPETEKAGNVNGVPTANPFISYIN